MMRVLRRFAISVALGVGSAIVFGIAPASLQEQTSVTTILRLYPPSKTDTPGRLVLSASLRTDDGKPLSNRAVDFYLPTQVFGRREARLGTATTDATGLALLAYEPGVLGPQTIRARFVGSEAEAGAQAAARIEVHEVADPFEPRPLPLAPLRQWLPVALVAAVLVVWAVLLGTLRSTAVALRAAVRATIPGRRPAAAPRTGGPFWPWSRPVGQLW